MIPNNHDCDRFEPLVSAMLDDELSPGERIELESHLECCTSCGDLVRDFQRIDQAVDALGFGTAEAGTAEAESVGIEPASIRPERNGVEAPMLQSRLTETFVVTRHKPSMKNWLSPWRLVPLAGVAALIVGLFIVVSQPATKAVADQISADEFVKPLADLNRINLQQQRDQDLMLKTLGMDLRALKLELKQLESAGPEDRQRLEQQIEMMLERVGSFEN